MLAGVSVVLFTPVRQASGHSPQVEEREAFVQRLRAFLERAAP